MRLRRKVNIVADESARPAGDHARLEAVSESDGDSAFWGPGNSPVEPVALAAPAPTGVSVLAPPPTSAPVLAPPPVSSTGAPVAVAAPPNGAIHWAAPGYSFANAPVASELVVPAAGESLAVMEPVTAVATLEITPEMTRAVQESGMRLGDLLIGRGLITQEQLEHALAEQVASGRRLGAELVDLGAISERQLIEALAAQLDQPVADLREVVPESSAVARLPEEFARKFEILPLRETPDGLELAVGDTLNGIRSEIEAAVGGPIVAVLAVPSEIRRCIDQAYMAMDRMDRQVKAFEDLASTRAKIEQQTQMEVDDNAPIVQVISILLTQAVRDRASDVHIEPQDGSVRVRFRIDGVLREVMTVPESMSQALLSRLKVMADMNIVERRRPQDGQITTTVDDRPLDIRVATTSTIWGEKAVLRLLDKTRSLRALSELGMAPATAASFSQYVSSPFGMVICAGPTGSGKTTSLYAALTEINDPGRNITTIEDPVEYILPSINQIQVNAQAGLTFADGLKSILRQDPDVILVGEIRDVETARIAVQSALTGHLVLSSLHAIDTSTALHRFGDMGIEPFLITSAVTAIIAQRLVRRICDHCKTTYEPTPEERTFFEENTGNAKAQYWHGAGCNLCSHTGYLNRIGVYELMRISEPIKQLVLAEADQDRVRVAAVADGMRTLLSEVLDLIDRDMTTVAEAIRTVYAV